MLRTLFFLLLTSACFLPLFSGTDEQIVRFSDLSFRDDAERELFRDHAGSTDPMKILAFLLTPYADGKSYPLGIATERINECVREMEKELSGRSPKKKIKYVYQHVHNTFLKVYSLENSFSALLEKGAYNCVSASALYAIVFSKLGIPYKIYEAPEHVYLLAYPDKEKIIIETTSPQNGYAGVSEEFMKKYVSAMVLNKLIVREELDTSTVSKVFNRYFFSSSDISLIQLAALQYNNFGVYASAAGADTASVKYFMKAAYLYKRERQNMVLRMVLGLELDRCNFTRKEDAKYLEIMCRYFTAGDRAVGEENIRNAFYRMTLEQLNNRSDYAMYEQSYKLVRSALKDSALLKEIDFVFHYELARIGSMTSKDKSYITGHLKAACDANPANTQLHGLVYEYFDQLTGITEDSGELLKLSEEFSNLFPFMNSNNRFSGFRADCLLDLAFKSFALNNISEGEMHLAKFEELCRKIPESIYKPFLVERAYSVGASAYYKKGNYKRAKQLLQTGLIYAPGNFGLQQRLREF
ncbi:MAG: hypothetical protein IT233_03065 [Bacteroidia bacterium]|nr:hypothetical protein [Bacteroidia bacterium]